MTLAKAQAVVSDILAAGYTNVTIRFDGVDWIIRVSAGTFSVPVNQVNSFINNHSVNGTIADVELS